jgi:hypothetical protein
MKELLQKQFFNTNQFQQMKKQFIILVSAALLSVTAWLAIAATEKSVTSSKTETCSKKCKAKPATTPTTGFFIIDSYSGIL